MSRKLWQGIIMATVIVAVLSLLLMVLPGCTTTAPAPTGTGPTTTVTVTAPAATVQPKNLIWESFVPPSPPLDAAKAFGKGMEDVSGGAITTTYNGGGVMGPPTGTFTHLVQGVADWAEFNPGYTPGIFPMSAIFELPIVVPNPTVISAAMYEMYKKGYVDSDYKDVKLLWYYGIGPYQLYSNKNITSFADFKGMKMRCPSDAFVKITEALGGTAVTIPGAELYTAMERGITDACWANGDMAMAFKLAEVTKYIVMLNIGNPVMTFGMNKAVFAALPQNVQRYIDGLGSSYYVSTGQRFAVTNALGLVTAKARGVQLTSLSDAEMQKVFIAVNPMFDKWVSDQNAAGRPGTQALRDFYYSLTEELHVPNPFPAPK